MQAKSVKKWVYRSRTQIAKDKPEKKEEDLAKLSRILCDCIKFPFALDLENGLSELFKIHFPILVNVCFFQPRVYLQMKKWTVDRKSIIQN